MYYQLCIMYEYDFLHQKHLMQEILKIHNASSPHITFVSGTWTLLPQGGQGKVAEWVSILQNANTTYPVQNQYQLSLKPYMSVCGLIEDPFQRNSGRTNNHHFSPKVFSASWAIAQWLGRVWSCQPTRVRFLGFAPKKPPRPPHIQSTLGSPLVTASLVPYMRGSSILTGYEHCVWMRCVWMR